MVDSIKQISKVDKRGPKKETVLVYGEPGLGEAKGSPINFNYGPAVIIDLSALAKNLLDNK